MSQETGGVPTRNRSASIGSKRSAKRVVPFWMMQAAEIAAVVALADLSVHVRHGGLLVGGGAALALLAVTAKGPLGILRICSRRLHLMLVMAVAALLALAPIVPGLRPDTQGIIIVEFVAVGMIRLATLTRADERISRSTRAPGIGSVIDTTASPIGKASEGRSAPVSAARWAGRATGVAATLAARSAAKHRPAAEAQLKRTIRGAGRLTGKVTSAPGEEGTTPD